MPQQLPFDLPAHTALGRDHFLVAPSNALAMSLVEAWPNWPGGKLVITGPSGSGKTHLAHVWAARSGAQILTAQELGEDSVPTLAQAPVAVEDVHLIANDTAAQAALFHLHNLTLAEGHSLLFTGVSEPKHWGLSLPDLASRLQGTQSAALAEPDDQLLMAVLAKLFDDRQLAPSPDTLAYLIKHIERSFEAARAVVAQLDQASLAQKKPITRAFAAQVLRR